MLIIDYCLAATCHPPRGGILPLMPHCQELVHKLLDASRGPRGLAAKVWGRSLENTATTVHLPKIYWVAGAGPRTCGVIVDADNRFPQAVERFNIGDVGHAADHIDNACLFRKGEVGTERVGVTKRVEVKLERVDVELMPKAGITLVDIGREDGRYLVGATLSVSGLLKNETRTESL
ncbi:MAG: hypothetical protein Q9186_006692 [Xanthomendoza sp. 1 TL-2023]